MGLARAGRGAARWMIDFNRYRQRYRDEVGRSVRFTGRDVDFFARIKTDCLIEAIERCAGAAAAARLLDVGCGVGVTDGFLHGRVRSLTGLDVAEGMVAEAAAANAGAAYVCGDGTRMPFADATFDVAFAICVFHHVPDPLHLPLLREMRRVTRPGGLVAIFEHNPWNPLTRLAVARCELDADARLLTMGRVRTLMAAARLRVVDRRYIVWTPFESPGARRLEEWLRRVPFGGQYAVVAQV
jgi:SAM-dependent methyltransferase